jgi:hypothetical protein
MREGANQGLDVSIIGDRLVISVGINCISNALELGPEFESYDEVRGVFSYPKVTDPVIFARELAIELERESEDGTTRVHRMFDAAAKEAIEQGAEGIIVPGDDRG